MTHPADETMAAIKFLPAPRQLARSIDGVYRDSAFSLVGRLPTPVLLLPHDAPIAPNASGDILKLEHKRAARLYSETARKATNQKSNTFVVIVSLCAASIPATIWTSF